MGLGHKLGANNQWHFSNKQQFYLYISFLNLHKADYPS